MLSFNLLVGLGIVYVMFLFLVAFVAERQSELGRLDWLRSPWVYTLSLSVYCTGWTFYGAVGYAARSGLEFVTIYLGPTIVMIGWFTILRKLVRIGRAQRITSISDLLSSRYGKSNLIGALVTILAVVGTTPYIALQLQSVTLSFAVLSPGTGQTGAPDITDMRANAIWVAAGLALFTIVFGTRNLDANERHTGVVTAIALEAVVKLVALLAVGLFVVWGVAGGPSDIVRVIEASPISVWDLQPDRWVTLTFIAGAAFLCLPRMFHVLVVENADERHLVTASWAFPLYLFLMSLFVIPIAAVGLAVMPEGTNPDLFVLTVPLAFDKDWLAVLSFLGGFSAATSMVIVATIALSIMVSNPIVLPIWLSRQRGGASMSGDVRHVLIVSRRLSIAGALALGYLYFRFSGGGAALAAIGLIAFVGIAQVLPAMLGGIFWRGATRVGAAAGLIVGFVVWVYVLFLPSFGPTVFSESVMANGPFGLGLFRPHALFGIAGMDPLVHAVFWSLSLNTAAFFIGSLLSFPEPLERLQGAAFVNVYRYSDAARGWGSSSAEAEDLLIMAQRIIGTAEAQALFQAEAARQGIRGYLPDVTPEFLERLERELAGSVGAATAHAMVSQITGGASVSVEDLMRVADETQQMIEYSSQLEAKSAELGRTARQLREANEKLMTLSVQKDAFLSQISHELRTPMTSIRAFSEILMGAGDLPSAERLRYATIIHDETLRLTRLLDALLDLSVLESGQVTLNIEATTLGAVIDRAIMATSPRGADPTLRVERDPEAERIEIRTDADRLSQVFINLFSNARKYADTDAPMVRIMTRTTEEGLTIDVIDNGPGIPKRSQEVIFEKFTRLSDAHAAGSAGLGLSICREIMARLGGAISYLPGQKGAAFRLVVPLARAEAA
jgi:Na+/proline symporter/nitrogen-specific signal transduction histidine kinase